MRVSPVLLSNPGLTRRKYVNNAQNPQNYNQAPKNVLNNPHVLSNAQNINFGIAGGLVVALVVLAGTAIDVGVLALLSEGEFFDLFKSNKKYESKPFEQSRQQEIKEVKKEVVQDVDAISKKMNVKPEEASRYLTNFVSNGMIKPELTGHEKGLNAVMGYGVEKYKLSTNFLSPIIYAQNAKDENVAKRIPNGLLLFGPPGSGKTYIAEKLCEHLEELGVKIKTVELVQDDHDKNVKAINKAFRDAKAYHDETKKYTIINFSRDIDNFFIDRNTSSEFQKEVSTIMHCAEDSAKHGAIMIATANNPRTIDKAVLRPGRFDIKMPIGFMKDHEIGDMIKYALIKYGDEGSAHDFDYERVVNYARNRNLDFTPSEYERDFVKQALNKKLPEELVTADDIIAEIDDYVKTGLMTLDEETKERFQKDKKYIDYFDSTDAKYNIDYNKI